MTENKTYILPFLRKGLAGFISQKDNLSGMSGDGSLNAMVHIDFGINAHAVGDQALEALSKDITLVGPAQVKSVSPNAINLCFPPQGSNNVAYTFLPFVEFEEADFPWRYTPLGASQTRLRPWVMLLVLREEEFDIRIEGENRILSVQAGSNQQFKELFPPLDSLDMLCHVQVVTDSNDPIVTLKSHPETATARLFALRQLEKDTVYTAFMVPSFEAGRLCGLGQDDAISNADIQLASYGQTLEETACRPCPLEFPIYHKWSFRTQDADFKNLAQRLEPLTQSAFASLSSALKVDISETGLQAYKAQSLSEPDPIDVPVALLKDQKNLEGLKEEPQEMRLELQEELAKSPVLTENAIGGLDMEHDPWVVPPIYAGRHMVAVPGDKDLTDSALVNELNLKMRHRAAAGMGSQIIQRNQESLMSRAWNQVEQINEINKRIREIVQTAKTNDASSRKVSQNSQYNLRDELSGMMTDALVKMSAGVGEVKTEDLVHDIVQENLKASLSTMGGYEIGQGITRNDLLTLTDNNVWREEWKYVILNHGFMRLVKGKENFADAFPQWNILRGVFKTQDEGVIVDTDKKTVSMPKDSKMDPLCFSGHIPHQLPTRSALLFQNVPNLILAWLSEQFDYQKNGKKKYYYSLQTIESFLTQALKDVKPLFQASSYATSGWLYDQCLPVRLCSSINGTDYNNGVIMPDETYQKNFSFLTGAEKGLGITYWSGNEQRVFVIAPLKSVTSANPTFVMNTCDFFGSETGTKTLSLDKDTEHFFTEEEFEHKPQPYHGSDFKKVSLNGFRPISGFNRYLCLSYARQALGDFIKATEFTAISFSRKKSWKLEHRNCTVKLSFDNDLEMLKMSIKHDSINIIDGDRKINYKKTEQTFYLNKAAIFIYGIKQTIEVNLKELEQFLIGLLKKFDTLNNVLLRPDNISWTAPDDLLITSAYEIAGGEEVFSKIQNFSDDIAKVMSALREQFEKDLKLDGISEPVLDNTIPSVERKDATVENRKRVAQILEEIGMTGHDIDIQSTYIDSVLSRKYPVMAYPEFPEPVSIYLREISERFLLPSVEQIPQNSITLFESNPQFEEALLAGMNTEMGRELLFREYPTDERGSYFRKFWDQEIIPENLDKDWFDVEVMQKWSNQLGGNHLSGKGSMLVFVVRGELLESYPDTRIYLSTLEVDQKSKTDVFNPWCYSTMTTYLTDSILLVGFSGISRDELRNKYLTFEEADNSLRFTYQPKNSSSCAKDSRYWAKQRLYDATIWGYPAWEIASGTPS